ncbi:FAD-binding protein [Salicibibacter kimchii]|uniref:FAD-binding protein n=1 Tax=Salicibibacter kimchii TaxID=2099786 RepID=UPI001D04DED2|nr:FAD-binding protein [Salicibibacter kimchii]
MNINDHADVLVIGSGAAGMMAARAAADQGANVIIVDKSLIGRGGATVLAQMTVAVALGEAEEDSIESHWEDTVSGGRGLSDPEIVRSIVERGPEVIADMESYRVKWARTEQGHRSQVVSPGHSKKRCVYVDILNTGGATSKGLRRVISNDEKIKRLKNVAVTRLVTSQGRVLGAVGFSVEDMKMVSISASQVILATGGLTEVFERNSASTNMTGDGFLLAAEAGCELRDMEMVQFFPIAHLYPPVVGIDPIMWDPFRYKLGGRLLNGAHEEFMETYTGEVAGKYTATRDLTSYAIFKEVEAGRGSPHGGAYLDFTMIKEEDLRKGFGPVIDILESQGIDLTKDMIEVAPMAHFMLGGVKVNNKLETTVPNLYACGELIYGMHGANRLSGNAMTEALVTGRIAGENATQNVGERNDEYVAKETSKEKRRLESFWYPSSKSADDTSMLTFRKKIQTILWKGSGPLRAEKELEQALCNIERLTEEISQTPLEPQKRYALPQVEKLEAYTMAKLGAAIVKGALERRESRGAHVRLDYPDEQEETFSSKFDYKDGCWSYSKVKMKN